MIVSTRHRHPRVTDARDEKSRFGETITEIDSIASSIAAAVEQQGAATAEIARNVAQTADAMKVLAGRQAMGKVILHP